MGAAKPCLGHASRTEAVLALRQEGLLTREISARTGIPMQAVTALEAAAKSCRPSQSTAGGIRMSQMSDHFSRDVLLRLGPHAAHRQISVDYLIKRIVDAVANDDIVAAVLDDEEAKPAEQPIRPSNDGAADLAAELAARDKRIVELEFALGRGIQVPPEWEMPRREVQIFQILAADHRDWVTRDQIHCAIWGDSETSDTQIVQSHISKMRGRLARFGVQIESRRHLGYRLIGREAFREVSR